MKFYKTGKGIWCEDVGMVIVDRVKDKKIGWNDCDPTHPEEVLLYSFLEKHGVNFKGLYYYFESKKPEDAYEISITSALEYIKDWYPTHVMQSVDVTEEDTNLTDVDAILKQRGTQYGEFGEQVNTIKTIMNALRNAKGEEGVITTEDIYNFFLVLKLVRFQTATDIDSIVDLQGYGKLIQKEKEKQNG